jgi:hypothetical protein
MSFTLELELDRLEAELATEVPAYVRGLAEAYAANVPAPFAPRAMRRLGSSRTALAALAAPELAPRALPLLRLLTPMIEDDSAVAAARSLAPSWAAYPRLMAARDVAANARFGRPLVPWTQWLHGAGCVVPTIIDWPDEVAGWRAPSTELPFALVERAWSELAARHGARGSCRIIESTARPRAFIVEPGREVIVVAGALTSPAMQFAALHELGHALAGLLSPVALPRVLDEAAASYVARLLETEGALEGWFTPLARPARDPVRLAMVMALQGYEAGLAPRIARPPWGLWHDPGAQAAYLGAERFADHWWRELGAHPPPGAFAAQLATQLAHVERAILDDRGATTWLRPI